MRAAECYVVCKEVMGEGIRGGTCNGRMVDRPFFGELGEGVEVGEEMEMAARDLKKLGMGWIKK